MVCKELTQNLVSVRVKDVPIVAKYALITQLLEQYLSKWYDLSKRTLDAQSCTLVPISRLSLLCEDSLKFSYLDRSRQQHQLNHVILSTYLRLKSMSLIEIRSQRWL